MSEVQSPFARPAVAATSKTTQRGRHTTIVSIVVIFMAIVLVAAACSGTSDGETTTTTETATTTAAPTTTGEADESAPTAIQTVNDVNLPSIAVAWLEGHGWSKDQIVTDESQFTEQPEERGEDAFGDTTAYTAEEYVSFLNENSVASRAALASFSAALSAEGYGVEELEVLLSNPDRWVAFQISAPAEWIRNSFLVGGEAVKGSNPRVVAAGDIGFVYITSDNTIVEDVTGRGDCKNPNGVPVPPGTAPKPKPPEPKPPGPDKDATKSVIGSSDAEEVLPEIVCEGDLVVNRVGKCVAPPTPTTPTTPVVVTPTTAPDPAARCAAGLVWNSDAGECQSQNTTVATVPVAPAGGLPPECPDGQSLVGEECVTPDTTPATGEVTTGTVARS